MENSENNEYVISISGELYKKSIYGTMKVTAPFKDRQYVMSSSFHKGLPNFHENIREAMIFKSYEIAENFIKETVEAELSNFKREDFLIERIKGYVVLNEYDHYLRIKYEDDTPEDYIQYFTEFITPDTRLFTKEGANKWLEKVEKASVGHGNAAFLKYFTIKPITVKDFHKSINDFVNQKLDDTYKEITKLRTDKGENYSRYYKEQLQELLETRPIYYNGVEVETIKYVFQEIDENGSYRVEIVDIYGDFNIVYIEDLTLDINGDESVVDLIYFDLN